MKRSINIHPEGSSADFLRKSAQLCGKYFFKTKKAPIKEPLLPNQYS